MIILIAIIAVCEVIRAIQAAIQLSMMRGDTSDRHNAYSEFVKSLKQTDREYVENLLKEFEKQDPANE